MAVTNFNAAQRFKELPKQIQEKLLNNVFCSNCGVTTIVNYTYHDDKQGVLLKGKCKSCSEEVARLVEDI